MKVTKEVFDLFIEHDFDCNLAKWRSKPFINSDGNVWATDGKAALIVSPKMTDVRGKAMNKMPNKPVLMKKKSEWKTYTYERLKEAVDACGVDEIMEYKDSTCPECDGFGEVEFEYYSKYKSDYFIHLCECPLCEGTGVVEKEMPSGRMEPTRKGGLLFVDAVISAWMMDRILKAMVMIGETELTVVSEMAYPKAVLFAIGSPEIIVMQMPVMVDDDKSKIVKIE